MVSNYEDPSFLSRPIYNMQAEECLLGACLLSYTAISVAVAIVSADDFYVPAHKHIFGAICTLFENGEPVDPMIVSVELRKYDLLEQIGGPAKLVNLQAATPATSNARRYATIIAEHSDARRVQGIALKAASDIANLIDARDVIEASVDALREIGSGRTDALPSNVWLMEDFLNRPEEERPPWIIPGIMRVGWRVILTATEGAGKTYLLRQIAASAAAGIHAFQPYQDQPPKRVLLVDLENPAEHIDLSMDMIQGHCASAPGYDKENLKLWHAPEGINLRSRVDRAKFDNLLGDFKPELVCLGPIYKSYNLSARETDEIAVREVQATLDDMRTRHKFGLLMEHHAAKASGGSKRSLDPYGTVFWMRWPEIGIGMEARLDSDEVIMGRWRGDRLPNSWPETVYRSQPFPWAGRWADGSMSTGATPILSVSAPAHHRPPASDEF